MRRKNCLLTGLYAFFVLSEMGPAISAEPALDQIDGRATTVTRILELTKRARGGNLTYMGQAPAEFSISKNDRCLIGMNVRLPVQQNWDGTPKEGQKIGFQIAVSFRDVREKFTQSDEYSANDGQQLFVVRFYGAPEQENNYGKKYYFEFYDGGRYVDLSSSYFDDYGGNLSLTPLGSYAAGDTFSLMFRMEDKEEAISLIQSAFEQCSSY